MFCRKLFLSPVTAGLFLLFLTACEDPSNVGIGLVGEQGGEPVSVVVPASSFENQTYDDETGGSARVIAGIVNDPALGSISAKGYIDFSIPAGVPSGFRDDPVTRAELRLVNNYVYGDTNATVTLRLFEMPAEWDDEDAPADTSYTIGPQIHEFSFAATDSLVVVRLPAEWVTAKDTTLRSAAFNTSFHGFHLAPVSENAVIGFNGVSSVFRVVAGTDSVAYTLTKSASTFDRSGEPQVPDNMLLVQDGLGPAASIRFDFESAGVLNSAINRTMFRLKADTTILAPLTPPGFYRPNLRLLELFAVTDTGQEILLGNPFELAENGVFEMSGNTLTSLVQRVLLGKSTVTSFLLRPPANRNTLDPVFLTSLSDTTNAPEVVLTVTTLTD